MHVGRPELPARRGLVRKAAGGDVVVQRVQPDIHHVVRRTRHRDAPGERGPADRQIAQPAAHEAHDLVAAAGGQDEVRLHLRTISAACPARRTGGRNTKAPSPTPPARRSAPPCCRPGAWSVRPRRRMLRRERRTSLRSGRDRCCPLASIRRHSSAQETLCRCSVVRIQSSYDTPIFTAMSRKSAEILSVKDCGSTPAARAACLDLLAVLVGAGQEEHVEPVQPLEARHHVGRDRGVGVARYAARRSRNRSGS